MSLILISYCHPASYLILGRELGPSGVSLTIALGESMPSRLENMFNLRLYDAATIQYSQLKFGHMHPCGMDYLYFSSHGCKCDSFDCIAAIRCGNAYHGPHSDSLYSGSEHNQFNSPRLVKCDAGFLCSGRVIRSPPLECVADGLGCLITAGPSGDGLPNESWKTQQM